MRRRAWILPLLFATTLAAPALGQEAGVALKPDDIKSEPFKDAKIVGSIKKGDAVTILKKQAGWIEIKAPQARGWVRVLSVRKGGSASAGSELAGVANVATGRAGTGQVVSTTGVRGLGEEDLKSAAFNEAEVKLAEAAAIAAEEARQFAAQAQLVTRPVEWLPLPKTAAAGGR